MVLLEPLSFCYGQDTLRGVDRAPDYIPIGERIRMANEYTNPPTVAEYLHRNGLLEHIILLKYGPSGTLERVSYVRHMEWFPENGFNSDRYWHPKKPRDISSSTLPSKYGRVAMLLNDDVVQSVDWSINPPITFLAYTLPSTVWDNPTFRLTPTPYDMYGFNRFCITLVDMVKTPFLERKPVIIWRGETHGMADMNRFLLIKMSEKNRDWLDCRSTLKDHSLRMERMDMSEYRYQIDIGGESGTTWGGLLWKMCSGSLIFKVETFSKDWWHDLLKPWEHYIPVEELVSDLPEKYEWVEKNLDKAAIIAQNGNDLCRKVSTEEFVWNYHKELLNNLPEATKEQVQEIDSIMDGLVVDATYHYESETLK